ncbi:MAG: hypothetical protein K8H86_03405 [Ignavibacteriaceae bacterium]|nr:hypothetical protein [Ignavibacteriaceae bacterium]
MFLFITPIIAQQADEKQKPESTDSVFVMSKSPWGSVLRSAVLPGLGQIYNHSYYKAPIIWGVSAYFIYGWIRNNNDYKNFAEAYNSNSSIYNKYNRDFYRDQRDMFSVYLGLTYILNLLDAYVDAQLFDFTVEEDFLTRYPMIGVKIPF